MGTRYLWAMLNSVLIALSFRGGYVSLAPDALRHANPDPILCSVLLVIAPIFAISTVEYSIRRWKVAPLPRPSWMRNPLRWWRDPLQALFIATCVMAAMAIGSALQRPNFGSVGFWMLGVYACFAVGLFLGQLLVYRIYRERIATS